MRGQEILRFLVDFLKLAVDTGVDLALYPPSRDGALGADGGLSSSIRLASKPTIVGGEMLLPNFGGSVF